LRARALVPFLVGLSVAGSAAGSPARAQAPALAPAETAGPSPTLAAPTAPIARRRPIVALLFVGVQSIQNEGSRTGPGLRLGLIGGGRLGRGLSLNGEVAYDVLNPDLSLPGVTFYNFEAALAPLFHLPLPRGLEALIGPKLGLFRAGASGQGERQTTDGVYTGLLVGANLGAFVRVSQRNQIELGGLLGFDLEKALACRVNGDVGGTSCSAGALSVQEIVSASAGVLF
jgi:hypothetical protein